MDYTTYCKKMGLKDCAQSKTMYCYYKEASIASTDHANMNEVMYGYNIYAPKDMVIELVPTTGCQSTYPTPAVNTAPAQKKEKTMYVNDDKHIESSKINYLSNRIDSMWYQNEMKIKKAFGLIDDESPQTALELVERIQNGKFMLNDETKKKVVYEPSRYIQWRDPAVKMDKEGAKAAQAVLEDFTQDVRDTVAIGTPAEGLAAVKTLQAWTPTVGNA